MKYLIWVIVGMFSLLFLRFLLGDAHQTPYSIKKDLYVTLKNDTPCFYVNSFEAINEFDIDYIHVETVLPLAKRANTTQMWHDKIDTNTTLPLSSITGMNQCIPYGIQKGNTTTPSKKLKTNVLYDVTMEGTKRNIPEKELKNGDSIWLYRAFYLNRNKTTGEIEIIMPDQSQVDTWFKKMKEQNQSK